MLGWILVLLYLLVAALPFAFRQFNPRLRVVWAAAATFLFLAANQALGIWTETLWFADLGYVERYWGVLIPEAAIFLVSFLVAFLFPIANFLFILRSTSLPSLFKAISVAVCFVFAGLFALAMTDRVYEYLRFAHQVPFGLADPIFNMDVGFYIFTLPFLKTLRSGMFLIVSATIIGSLILYGPAATRATLQSLALIRQRTVNDPSSIHRIITHLAALGILLLAIAVFWTQIEKWNLVYSLRGAVFGAGWTDVHVQIMSYNVFMGALCVSGALLAVSVFSNNFTRMVKSASLGLLICVATWVIGVEIVPWVVQRYSVAPNELARESEYIKYNIEFTRVAYGLTDARIKQVDYPVNFSPAGTDIISRNKATFENVRIWDWRVLQSNNNQYQGFRLYYTFPSESVVRYTINGKLQQLMYAAREMDVNKLATQAQTWQNQHLVYTHGFGAVANPVNKVTAEGAPDYWIRDIPPVSKYPELQITQPRIYFGEMTTRHVYVNTAHQEFDYPLGDKNATYQYEAATGIALDSFLKKMAFAVRIDGVQLLTASEVTPTSKLLWRRDIGTRVRTLAPFLRYDADRYQVIANGHLFYIWDAYTHSRDFPYSEPYRGKKSLNYIRNSVKVVMNAYTGKVDFYIFDPDDPIIRTYQNIFPGMFKRAADMPKELRAHVRYPEELLTIQGDIFSTYHMSEPGVFYNREDAWQPAAESSHGKVEPIMPYYVVMNVPGETKQEFVLIRPFSPLTTNAQSPRNNMVSWLAARCDGEQYGKLLLFKFPKERLVYGPLQINARMNQDDIISKDMTLWNQQGSQVVLGNLIIIPLSDYRLLYVQPIYIQATVGKMPELKRVVVSLGEALGYGLSFEDALSKLIGGYAPAPTSPGGKADTASPHKDRKDIVRQAAKALGEYQALQGSGKFGEAGRKLEEVRDALKSLLKE